MKKYFILVACCSFFVLTNTYAQPKKLSPIETALDAYRRNNINALSLAAAKLTGHVMEPYARYWMLASDWSSVSEEQLLQFTKSYPNTPLADRARLDWVNYQLQENKQQENKNPIELLRTLENLQRPDNTATCLRWEVSWQQSAILNEVSRWLAKNNSKLPSECHRVLNKILPALSEQDRWIYIRALWYEKKTDLVIQAIERIQYPVGRTSITQASNNAELLLSSFSMTPENSELGVLALMRLARANPPRAVEYLQYLPFSGSQRRYLWGHIAMSAAKDHLPQAQQWFELTESSNLSEEQWEWRIRSALRQQDWQSVRTITRIMPQELMQEPTWIYWRARALKILGYQQESESLFLKISQQQHFYALLAREELGQPTFIPQTKNQDTKDQPPPVGIIRSFVLLDLGLRTQALIEWQWALKEMTDAQLLSTAMAAQRQGYYDRMIDAAMRTQSEHDFSLRYPMLFRNAFKAAANKFGIEETYAYGISHQESHFSPDVRSSAGAAGLMQLMPTTAKWVSQKFNVGYHPTKITDPYTNVSLGAAYLRTLFDKLKHPALVAAGYNAGPSRAQKWRHETKELDGAIYTETIPFTETRQYVKKVLANVIFYSHLTGYPIALSTLLPPVKSPSPVDDAEIEKLP